MRKSASVDRRLEVADSLRCMTATTWPVMCEDFSVGADYRFTPHSHPRPHICFVIDGTLIERDGAGLRRLLPGTGRLSPAGDEHHLTIATGPRLRCLVLELEPEALDQSGTPFPRDRRYVEGPGVPDLARRLSAELRSVDDASPISLEMLGLEAAALGGATRGPEVGQMPHWLGRVRERVLDDLRSVPTLSALSDDAGVSRAHLARVFRAHFGCTIGQYVRGRRLEAARKLILHTEVPLASVACEAGFADQSHLTRLVGARFGQSPGRLRTSRREA